MTENHGAEVVEVEVDGYRIVTYSYGTGDNVLLLLNGGPGLPCDYLRDPHIPLANEGYRVIAFDQLGCGNSDRPEDPSLILANSCGDLPHLTTELNRMREALGSETVAMMQHHEALGTLDHPEYQAAITILNYRHVCRLKEWPAAVLASVNDWNMGPYGTMQGPNEFLYIGNLKDWNRIPDMHQLKMPTLIVTGTHDEIGPACALKMDNVLPNSEVVIFPNSSHVPFFEEPEDYFGALKSFLERQA